MDIVRVPLEKGKVGPVCLQKAGDILEEASQNTDGEHSSAAELAKPLINKELLEHKDKVVGPMAGVFLQHQKVYLLNASYVAQGCENLHCLLPLPCPSYICPRVSVHKLSAPGAPLPLCFSLLAR